MVELKHSTLKLLIVNFKPLTWGLHWLFFVDLIFFTYKRGWLFFAHLSNSDLKRIQPPIFWSKGRACSLPSLPSLPILPPLVSQRFTENATPPLPVQLALSPTATQWQTGGTSWNQRPNSSPCCRPALQSQRWHTSQRPCIAGPKQNVSGTPLPPSCYAVSWNLRLLILEVTELNWTELNWTELNWTELNWTELNWTELNWTELNWTELNWTELNWTELNWTSVSVCDFCVFGSFLCVVGVWSVWCLCMVCLFSVQLANFYFEFENKRMSKILTKKIMLKFKIFWKKIKILISFKRKLENLELGTERLWPTWKLTKWIVKD